MSNTTSELQLAKIEQAENRLKAKKQKVLNTMKTAERKIATRRKILLGSVMLKIASESEASRQKVKKMVSSLQKRDQEVFESLFKSWSNQP
ncbi:hypothetical protein JYT23_00565 [Mariprofundus ferrooxydans]|nr:hypothetical protein [Mariprofundus ferrooxydans]